MQQKCALCPAPAAFYCVNDDAHLCASCDASVHTGNPLLARHERRSLTACHTECASAAHTTTCSADDVAVVPQFAQPASVQQPAAAELEEEPVAAALLAGPAPAPATGAAAPGFDAPARDFAADLLDIDLPLLDFDFKELEATERDSFSDCVVPSAFDSAPSPNPAFANFPPVPASLPILHQHAATAPAPTAPLLHRAHSSTMVPVAPSLTYSAQPSGFSSYTSSYSFAPSTHHMVPTAVVPQAQPQRRPAMGYTSSLMPTAASAAASAEEEEAREERVRRHRQQKRAKRNLGRTVRYQSRKAYAMIRPRIKGRFVSPEEWEAHLAAQSGASPQTSDLEASEAIVPAVY